MSGWPWTCKPRKTSMSGWPWTCEPPKQPRRQPKQLHPACCPANKHAPCQMRLSAETLVKSFESRVERRKQGVWDVLSHAESKAAAMTKEALSELRRKLLPPPSGNAIWFRGSLLTSGAVAVRRLLGHCSSSTPRITSGYKRQNKFEIASGGHMLSLYPQRRCRGSRHS
eukprot:3644610-Rhodomonas_salina.3